VTDTFGALAPADVGADAGAVVGAGLEAVGAGATVGAAAAVGAVVGGAAGALVGEGCAADEQAVANVARASSTVKILVCLIAHTVAAAV
jgi:hypothetical protein